MYPVELPSLLLHLLLITGSAGALTISADQLHVTGYENAPIILAVSYNTSGPTDFLQIRWLLRASPPKMLAMCTIVSGRSQHYTTEGYDQRMRIVPQNGSLVINRLWKNDSGLYELLIQDRSSESLTINVTVKEREFQTWREVTETPPTSCPCVCPGNSTIFNVPTSAWIILGSRLSSVLIALSVFCGLYLFHQKPKRSARRKT